MESAEVRLSWDPNNPGSSYPGRRSESVFTRTLFCLLLLFSWAGTCAQARAAGYGVGESYITITGQPESRTNVVGSAAPFTLATIGGPLITYQWRFNGTNLVDLADVSGANTATLTLAYVRTNHDGLYSVVLRNSYGSVTSAVARLTVRLTPPQDQFNYTTNNGTLTITGYAGTGGDVSIPESIDGLPVTEIGTNAFYYATGLTNVTLPNSVTTIGGFAFSGCTGLRTILLPNSLTSIGGSAFSVCSGLTSIALPNSVTNVGSTGFSHCTGLTNVTLGTNVTSIGDAAFSYCTGLRSVTLPNSVTRIGGSAFAGCAGLTSVVLPDGLTSIGDETFRGCGGLTSLILPAMVSTIGEQAFASCPGLTDISLPNAVTNLGAQAFAYSPGLKSITIPGGVVTIQPGLFSGCFGLTNVTLSGGVTGIGGSAFYGCTVLTSITLPNGVTRIGDSAFAYCGLTVIFLPDSVTSIEESAFYGCHALTNVVLPNGVTSVGNRAFASCTGLTSITLPDGLPSIGTGLFSGCSKLTSLTLPSGVTSIGASAFNGCSRLASIVLPKGVATIGDRAFAYCSGLTSLTLPESLTNIASYAFSWCTELTSLYLTGSPPTLGVGMLEFANKATVYYPAGAQGWGLTFGGHPTTPWLPAVMSVTSTGVRTNQFEFQITGGGGLNVVVEASTNLANPAWFPLETNTLSGDSVRFTDPQWTDCPARFYRLRSPDPSGENTTAPPAVVWIEPGTFTMGSPTNEVDRFDWEGPQTKVTISHGFWMSKYETTQAEYQSLMGINPSHCNGERGQEGNYSVDLDRPVETVTWNEAVTYCAKLTARERAAGRLPVGYEYRLPTEAEWEYAGRAGTTTRFSYGDDPGYKRLGEYAWYGANSRGTTHPGGIKKPNAWGLYDMHGNVSEWCLDAWSGGYPGGSVTDLRGPITVWFGVVNRGGGFLVDGKYCRSASRYLYGPGLTDRALGFRLVLAQPAVVREFEYTTTGGRITITGYAGPGGDVSIPSTIDGLPVVGLGWSAFARATNLTSVSIPDSVTSIEGQAFVFCTSLTSVTLPDSITFIGGGVFAGCTSLTNIEIPSRVTWIGEYTFHWCTSLTGITIPSSVTSIGDEAFEGCTSLATLSIGAGVTNIAWRAFYGCTSLAGVYFKGNAPSIDSGSPFGDLEKVIVYYVPGTAGWGATFGDRPTMPWSP